MQTPFKSDSVLYFLLSFFVLSLVIACQEEEAITLEETPEATAPVVGFPGVDRALWSFFEDFEERAAEQGFFIDLAELQITGVIEDLEEDFVAGQCTYYSNRPNHVIVDAEFWERSSDDFKEMIIFHELGHCVLGRDHREGRLDNGFCLSIMRSGQEPCRDAYNAFTRDYYVEELFHPDRVN